MAYIYSDIARRGGYLGKRTGGYSPGYQSAFDEYYSTPTPSMEELLQKYLPMVPKVDIPSDPEKLYEGIMGSARQDVQRRTEQIGLGLQKYATRGSSYEDMLARYLPGAIEPLAKTAGEAGAQAQKFAQAGATAMAQQEQARFAAASEIATIDRAMQEESRRFLLDLKARVEMAEREIAAKERIALAQARSAEHIARIRANSERERARILANAQMETTKFAQEQANYRETMRLQTYDKWYSGNLALQGIKVAPPYQTGSYGEDTGGGWTDQMVENFLKKYSPEYYT